MDQKLAPLARTLDCAIEDASFWRAVCDESAKLFGGRGAVLLPIDPAFRGKWLTHSSSLQGVMTQYIAEGWHLRDERQALTPIVLTDGVATDDQLADRADLAVRPYWRDLLLPHGLGFIIGILLDTPNGHWCLCIQFPFDRPPITDQERLMALAIGRMLSKASASAIDLARGRLRDFAKLMSETVRSVHLLDPLGEETLRFGLSLGSDPGDGQPVGIEDLLLPDDFSGVLSLCTNEPESRLSFEKMVRIGGGQHRLTATQLPVSLRHFHMSARIVVYIAEVLQVQTDMRRKLRRHFQITEAEFDAVDLLARGHRIRDIAEASGLKESTIRQRFKLIYQKMSVSTQSQLVARYHDLNSM